MQISHKSAEKSLDQTPENFVHTSQAQNKLKKN